MNLENINLLIDKGYICKQKHPTADLYIYNYTPRCQYERIWNEETLSCRGLIMDGNGKIVARPFKKFFNIEEHSGPLPDGDFKIFDKLDGSLGILYWIGETPYIATRGSFVSEQSIEATKMLYGYRMYWEELDKTKTYLFEIIYPENRIVVDYKGMKNIILLAVIDTETGREEDLYDACSGFPFVDEVKEKNINKLKDLEEENKEGFVVKWENGFRLKIKFEEYKRLHRLLTMVTARSIWECLMTGEAMDELLDRVPDEYYRWVKNTKENLEKEFNLLESEAALCLGNALKLGTRKEQADYIIETRKYPGIVFAMLDKKDYKKIIWRLLRPAATKPFREEI